MVCGSKYTAKVDSLLSSDVQVSVTNFVAASIVLCFCRKPNWLSISIVLSYRKNTTFSVLYSQVIWI